MHGFRVLVAELEHIVHADEEKGIRIENTYDEETGVYTSTLWADNITMKAAGDYYCYVQDKNNGSMESGRVNLKVYE